ncbi:MAG: type II toxin-antitoxin system VapC family toxin [Victivallales bacterium]|nr:type II toxin-antitoxin system VapC family toxin [Victivallales bacterium]
MSEEKKLKVYLETSFVSYLTGRATTREPVALWQAASRQWWEAVRPSCDLFISEHVLNEIQKGAPDDVVKRTEIIRNLPVLGGSVPEVSAIAERLIAAHALPAQEVADAYHIATAAYYGMDVLLTWNCRHMANEFTLPKTYGVLKEAGLDSPVIITPKRYMEDANHDE